MNQIITRNRSNKRKGYRWEADVCAFFDRWRWRRNGQRHGQADQGDIDTGDVPIAVQCKDVARLSLWKAVADAETQAYNKDVGDWVVMVKRRGAATGEGLAVVPLWLFRDMAEVFYGDPDRAGS